MHLRLFLTGLVAAIIGIIVMLAFWPDARHLLLRTHAPGHVTTSGKAKVGGPFSLIAHTGTRVSDTDLRGQNLIVFFGYSFAPDTTPAALQLITDVLERLGPKAQSFQPLFMTIDPQRDTPERLAAFIGKYHPAFLALTGTPAELESVARAYVVHKFERPRDASEPRTYDHSSYIYLMDRQGAYAAHIPHMATTDEVRAALQAMN